MPIPEAAQEKIHEKCSNKHKHMKIIKHNEK
jgi:hypothetical protein